MTKAAKAVILARVSTKDQEEGYSIEAQLHRLEGYCVRKNLEVVSTFKIIESSSISKRKQFMEVIAYIKKSKEPIALVADKVDRVQRSFQEYPVLNPLIQEGRLEMHFNTEGYTIHKESVSQERLMWSIGVVMAQSYVDSLRDNINRSIAQKLRGGEWVSTAPVGYLHVKEDGKGDIVIDPDRAPLVRRMFEHYATGNYTLAQMAGLAKEWGLRNSRGKQKGLTETHILQFLQNPFYYGVMRVKTRGAEYPHRYPPIIDKLMFDRCQEVRLGRSQKTSFFRGKDYALRGLLTCAASGRMVTAETHKKTYKNGSSSQWTYLSATDPQTPGKRIYVREEEVLAQVEDALAFLNIEKNLLANVLKFLRKTNDEKQEFQVRQTATLRKQHTEITDRLYKLLDMFVDKVIERPEYEENKKRLQDRRFEISVLLDSFDRADDAFTDKLADLITIANGASSTFKDSDATRRRELLSFVFQNLKLNGKNLEYSMRTPFKEFAECLTWEDWWTVVNRFRIQPELRLIILSLPSQGMESS